MKLKDLAHAFSYLSSPTLNLNQIYYRSPDVERVRTQGQKAIQRQNRLESYIERSARKKASEEAMTSQFKGKKENLQAGLDKIIKRQK